MVSPGLSLAQDLRTITETSTSGNLPGNVSAPFSSCVAVFLFVSAGTLSGVAKARYHCHSVPQVSPENESAREGADVPVSVE